MEMRRAGLCLLWLPDKMATKSSGVPPESISKQILTTICMYYVCNIIVIFLYHPLFFIMYHTIKQIS